MILFYTAEQGRAAKRFEREVLAGAPGDSREVFHTLEDLIERLMRFDGNDRVLVYLAATTKELTGLCAISHLLGSVRLILIAPDRSEKTITRAHSLYPRFLIFVDGDFSEVADVLAKMISQVASGEPRPDRDTRGNRTETARPALTAGGKQT